MRGGVFAGTLSSLECSALEGFEVVGTCAEFIARHDPAVNVREWVFAGSDASSG